MKSLENYDQLMKKIIDIFKPGKMNVTIMANKVHPPSHIVF